MITPGYAIHIVKSFGLHIFFGVVVVLSFSFSAPESKPEKVPEVSAIDAVVIDAAALEQQVTRIKTEQAQKKAAEEKRVQDLERRANQAKRELDKLNKQQKDSQKAAEDAKRKANQEKAKAEQAKKERLQREKEAKKAAADALAAKKKKEAEQKALKEAEQKRQEELARQERERKEKERREAEAKEKALQEKMMQEQLAQEQARRRQARQKVVVTEVQKFTALITAKIQQNLILDESMKGKSCRLNIRLAFSGLVTKVTILSGDQFMCQAAQRAVLRAETLPVSKEPDVFEELRSINLTVEPKF